MKRKSPAKNLSEKLGRAKFEFLKRNAERYQAYCNKHFPEELKKTLDRVRKDYYNLSKYYDKCIVPGIPEKAREFYQSERDMWAACAQQLEENEILLRTLQPEFAYSGNNMLLGACIKERVKKREKNKPCQHYTHHVLLDETNQRQYREDILNNAKEIMSALIGNSPSQKLLIVADLNWTKEAIKAQVGEIIDEEHKSYCQIKNGRTGKQTRAKWLSVWPKLLEVWDLYNAAGQRPASRTFAQIATKVKRPLSTVKGQWRLAYQGIYGKPYDPEIKYTNDDKLKAAEQLCAKCPYGAKCYRSGDWFPCTDYLAISGKERNIKTTEYNENIDYEGDYDDDIDA